MCWMYEACESVTWCAARWISTFNKSDTGPSSSTFHRAANASNEPLVRRRGSKSKDAGVRRGLREPVVQQPREQGPLPSPASLDYPVDGLFDAADAGAPIFTDGGVAGRRMTVHDLALLKLTLEVGGNEVPPAHEHAGAGCDGGERPQGGGPHGSAEGLVVVHARRLGAALHKQARFESAASFPLVNPKKAHERAPRRELGAVDERPTVVGHAIIDFGALGCGPFDRVVGHCLLPRPRVGGNRRCGEGATVAAHVRGCSVVWLMATSDKERGRTERCWAGSAGASGCEGGSLSDGCCVSRICASDMCVSSVGVATATGIGIARAGPAS
eukprot:6212866-Pleurochrysis_carterae.AAC.7